jgi:hypothetical protein
MLELCDVCLECDPCMHDCLLCVVIFPAIETNDDCTEEGEVFAYQEKEIRDKLTKASHLLVAYLNPTKSLCIVLLLFS